MIGFGATPRMKSTLANTGAALAALLLVSLETACGSSNSVASADGGADENPGAKNDEGASFDAGAAAADEPGAADDARGSDAAAADGGATLSKLAVPLGAAGNYVILAKTGISTVPTSAITGNLGISPAAATYLTGFALTADPTNVFSTSPQVTGKLYASDYSPPTPSDLTTAIGDMQTAFTDAAGRAPNVTELGAGNIGGMTIAPGVYKWGTGLLIPTDVTLAGNAADVWIFQIAQGLTMSSAAHVVLSDGAVARNVFWEVAGLVDFGTTAHGEGIVLTQTSITLRTGASINGRLLAQTAVNMSGSAVVQPAQ
jgi:ice-binding like protein